MESRYNQKYNSVQMEPNMTSDVAQFYQQSDSHQWGRFTDKKAAQQHFEKYVGFIHDKIPAGGMFLDLGCSPGWSCVLISELGYTVTGLDMSYNAFMHQLAQDYPGVTFTQGNITRLEAIEDNGYDVVSSYQMIEHVETPQAALDEMIRVVRPGGYILVVGPNLLSPIHSVRSLVQWIPKEQPFLYWWVKNPKDPNKPFGNTLPQAVWIGLRNLMLLARKTLLPGYSFSFRQPDFTPPSHGDSDAVYLLNPLDLTRYFRSRGLEIAASSGGRFQWLGPLAGGTWVLARKKRG